MPLVLHDTYLPRRRLYRRALLAADALRFHTARRVLGFFRTRVKKPAAAMVPPAVAIYG